jgi:disulfide bond formation protein DsbB
MESEPYLSPIVATAAIGVVFLSLFVLLAIELPAAGRLRDLVDGHVQKGMLTVALVATVSSLYYSEVVEFIPCEFCWFQRIVMYPLAILLLVAAVTRSRVEPRYLVTLAFIGLGLSVYHAQLQMFPDQGEVCSGFVSCTDRNVEEFGFVSIPFMAGCGFLTILLLQTAEWRVDYLYRRWGAAEAVAAGKSSVSLA